MLSGITHLICAVDGGGTGCRALIADAGGNVLARASGGPANYTTNPAQAAQSVLDAVRAAARLINTPLDMATLTTHVGLAGILTPHDVADMVARLPFAVCTVSDDRMTSALGVLGPRDGAVLAVGTGSFVAARRGADVTFWGGWGLAVGDQASGAWLGRAVLEHSLYAADGLVPQSALTRAVLSRFNDTPTEIATFAVQATPSEFATFAPMVVSAATDDDAAGRLLMSRGAEYLNKVLDLAGITETETVCLTGGVGPHYEPYLQPAYRARIEPPAGVALDGALHLARQQLKERESQA
ncbi:BadF/BadG/BcrA/BcrD ATPase family protein [Tateyamaria pelophila]|uniref:BadF/BadG/BcrA/BcrD ATPase family protein n=1 Tax=Tateyamaria pelophila TaxID=328415 RepID=UPI001CBFDB13|nr:BadF/BadG/BcrA/BcrD ATPase family protein [Tateyamaria pelophila]